jgi:hypothetical protein
MRERLEDFWRELQPGTMERGNVAPMPIAHLLGHALLGQDRATIPPQTHLLRQMMSADVEASLPAFFAAPAPAPAAPAADGAPPLAVASDCALFFLRAMSPRCLVSGQLIRPVGRRQVVACADVAIDNKFRLGTAAVAELGTCTLLSDACPSLCTAACHLFLYCYSGLFLLARTASNPPPPFWPAPAQGARLRRARRQTDGAGTRTLPADRDLKPCPTTSSRQQTPFSYPVT